MRDVVNKREILGLGVVFPGMISKGTLDREDEEPPSVRMTMSTSQSNSSNLRQTLALRPEIEQRLQEENQIERDESDDEDHDESDNEEDDEDEDEEEEDDDMNVSVVSSGITDKYGFFDANASAAERRSAVLAPSDPKSIETQRRREAKWLHMIKNWDDFMIREYPRVRNRCRKGIPSSVRAKAWMYLCGAQHQLSFPENSTKFKRLYNQQGNQKYVDDIEKDLHRNFPTHEMFGGVYERIGQTELYRVLKAYSVLNPVDGYCQAMAPLAALLLMNMPSEQAFWCLVAICDRYIPGYYSPGMEAIQLDGDILFGLLKKVSPGVYKHLKKQNIEPVLYMTEWFLCVFARTLPWPSVMRVWDMFMCEGVKVLFRVGIVLLKYSLPRSVRKKCPSMYETLEVLKNLPEHVTDEDFLVEQVLKLRLSESDMERENRRQLKRRRALRAENNQNGTAN